MDEATRVRDLAKKVSREPKMIEGIIEGAGLDPTMVDFAQGVHFIWTEACELAEQEGKLPALVAALLALPESAGVRADLESLRGRLAAAPPPPPPPPIPTDLHLACDRDAQWGALERGIKLAPSCVVLLGGREGQGHFSFLKRARAFAQGTLGATVLDLAGGRVPTSPAQLFDLLAQRLGGGLGSAQVPRALADRLRSRAVCVFLDIAGLEDARTATDLPRLLDTTLPGLFAELGALPPPTEPPRPLLFLQLAEWRSGAGERAFAELRASAARLPRACPALVPPALGPIAAADVRDFLVPLLGGDLAEAERRAADVMSASGGGNADAVYTRLEREVWALGNRAA